MNRILVVGPTYTTEVIKINNALESSTFLPASIKHTFSGGSYAIASNLTVLDVDTHLITRMGNDEIANLMYIELDKRNGFIYSNNSVLFETPKKVYLIDKDGNQHVMDNVTYDAYPALTDNFPAAHFEDSDYGIANVINTQYLKELVNHYPNIHWVSENNIPAEEMLKYFDGVVIEKIYFDSLVRREEKYDYINYLLRKGLKWLIIIDEAKEANLFTMTSSNRFHRDNQGKELVGSAEIFTSMLVACLTNDYSLNESIDHAINLTNDMSYQKDIFISKELFEGE